MNKEVDLYQGHLLICNNDKADGCGSKGAMKLRDELKPWASHPDRRFKGKVRVNVSGCLGQCERGIAAVLYPQGKWLLELTQDDAQDLKDLLTTELK